MKAHDDEEWNLGRRIQRLWNEDPENKALNRKHTADGLPNGFFLAVHCRSVRKGKNRHRIGRYMVTLAIAF